MSQLLTTWFYMGGYYTYVWSAYGIAFFGFSFYGLYLYRSKHKTNKLLKRWFEMDVY